QGVGSGAIIASTYASIARAYTETERPRMFAIMSSAWVLPAIVGPAAAGFIAASSTWRLVFAGLLPFVVLAAALTVPALRALGASVLVRGLLTFAFFGTEAFLPLMLREARGLSPAIAGVVLTTGGLTWTSGSWVHARVAPRLTSRAIISTAFALVAIGAAGVLAVLLDASVPVELAYLAWAVS